MVIGLDKIHKSYVSGFWMHRRTVLQGLDLHIEAGEAYGLLGDNGAGKSTTLRILLGLTRADRGTGTMFGYALGDSRARRKLGFLPETPSFHDQLTALEFLRYMGRLSGWRGADLRARALTLLERLELGPARDLRLRKMSKGMLQRLGLAQALLGEPELLVLDEPMSGLDPQGRKLVRDLILEQRDAGRTVVFSTHILSDVEVVCTRAGILRRGTIERTLRLDDLGRLGAASVEVQAVGLAPHAVANLKSLARQVVQTGPSWLFTVAPGTPLRELMQGILAAGGDVQSVVPRRVSLEEVFLGAATSPKPADASAVVAPRTPVGVAT